MNASSIEEAAVLGSHSGAASGGQSMFGKELQVVSTALAEIDRVSAGIAALRERYGGVVFDVTTPKGMEEAKAARHTVRQPRYEIERIRKEAKRPILDLGRRLDAEAARITEELLKIEEPIDAQIKAEEKRREGERKARIEAENRRIAAIKARIAELQGDPMLTPTSGSVRIAVLIAALEAIEIDDSFEEFRAEAESAKAAGLARLRKIHDAALAHEAEQERLRREREELERQRAEERRKREIQERIHSEIRALAMQAASATSVELDRLIARAEAITIDNSFAEFREQAELDKIETLIKLRSAREVALKREEEERRLAEERARLEEETRRAEEARKRTEAAMQKLQAIQHQLLIADTGRAPHIKGRTAEGVDILISETEKWAITEEEFGALYQVALDTRSRVLESLRQRRAEFVEEERRRAELDRIEEEQRAAREAEERRRAEEQAERERQEERARLQREEEERKAAERARLASLTPPPPSELIGVIEHHYDVPARMAAEWLALVDWKEVLATYQPDEDAVCPTNTVNA